jgi:hypothetical protein
MFTRSKVIPNEGVPSFINEVCFHPDGKIFAATYEHNNEVKLFDARSQSLIRVIRNPDAALNGPHGLLVTQKHIIVANKGAFPCEFRIFRLGNESSRPSQTYTTPYAHLAEGHSLALNGRRLVVTYCEGRGKKGAIVSYDYDDENGRIVGPVDIQERWFRRFGDAKGVSFNAAGDAIYVTFQSDPVSPRLRGLVERVKNAVSFGLRGRTSRNGIAMFAIDAHGRFGRRPLWRAVFSKFCRLENIHVRGEWAVLSNPDDGCVQLHDLQRDRAFQRPQQVLRDSLVFPHGAKMSPDGSLLLVSDNGLEVVDHEVRWKSFVSPRSDGLVLFERDDLRKAGGGAAAVQRTMQPTRR